MIEAGLSFYFIILSIGYSPDWRESPAYLTRETCIAGIYNYVMSEEYGPFSECYARGEREDGEKHSRDRRSASDRLRSAAE